MTYADLFSLVDESNLTVEAAAKRLDVSLMTLSRWRRRPPNGELPPLYARAFRMAALEMVAEGALPAGAAVVKTAIAGRPNAVPFQAALRHLRLPPDAMPSTPGDLDGVVAGLARIGQDPENRDEVDRHVARLGAFRRLGSAWRDRIDRLMRVIRSPKLSRVDKLVAYGAVFYLLCPFDLIPDAVPGFGLLDDFAILGLAIGHYAPRGTSRRADDAA